MIRNAILNSIGRQTNYGLAFVLRIQFDSLYAFRVSRRVERTIFFAYINDPVMRGMIQTATCKSNVSVGYGENGGRNRV